MQCILCIPHSLISPFSSFSWINRRVGDLKRPFHIHFGLQKKGKSIAAFTIPGDPCVRWNIWSLYFILLCLFSISLSFFLLDVVAADQVRKFRPVADLSVPSGIRKVRPIWLPQKPTDNPHRFKEAKRGRVFCITQLIHWRRKFRVAVLFTETCKECFGEFENISLPGLYCVSCQKRRKN